MDIDREITVGLAQISPVWLNKDKTLDKIIHWINKAVSQK